MTCVSATIARDPGAPDRPFHLESWGEATAASSGTLMCMCRYRDALPKFLPDSRTSSSAPARPGLRISKTRTENLAFEAAGRGNKYFQVSHPHPPSSWRGEVPSRLQWTLSGVCSAPRWTCTVFVGRHRLGGVR